MATEQPMPASADDFGDYGLDLWYKKDKAESEWMWHRIHDHHIMFDALRWPHIAEKRNGKWRLKEEPPE